MTGGNTVVKVAAGIIVHVYVGSCLTTIFGIMHWQIEVHEVIGGNTVVKVAAGITVHVYDIGLTTFSGSMQ